MCFCNAAARITHSAVRLGALGWVLTFMVGRVFERGLQSQAEACPYRYMAGKGWVREEEKGHEEGGNPSNPGRAERNGTTVSWGMWKRSKPSWRTGDVEAVYHQQSSRIFHDFNSPAPSRKVAGGQRSQPCISIMSCEAQAEVAGEAGRHMVETLGGNMLAAVHKQRQMGLKDPVDWGHCVLYIKKVLSAFSILEPRCSPPSVVTNHTNWLLHL